MDQEISRVLLRKYANGRCTDAEKRLVEAWHSSPELLPPLFPDEAGDAAQQLLGDSKTADKTTMKNLDGTWMDNTVSVLQSWFLKPSDKY